MHWTQLVYACLLLASTGFALRDRRETVWPLIFAMWFNFGATYLLAFDVRAVLVADVLTAAFLTMRGRREGAVAILFILMVPVYVAGGALGWEPAMIYTAIDGIAYLQLLIMGWPNAGFRNRGPDWHRRGFDRPDPLVAQRDTSGVSGRIAGETE